jgi:hypothetical protein
MIVNPQVWFNTVSIDQASQSIAWFVTSYDTRQRHAGSEPRCKHCDSLPPIRALFDFGIIEPLK